MEMEEASCYPVAGQIPVDFKLRKSLTGNGLTVHDSQGRLAFRIGAPPLNGSSSSSSRHIKTLFDAAGNPLITVVHHNDEWQGFKGNSQESKDLIFIVKKILYTPFETELHVFLPSANLCCQILSFRLKGNPFRRACTIIQGNSIVAQTSLMYKLRKIIYSRHKFRLTVYPGNDCVLVLAMLMTFFWR
ncbi:hypothetical protein Cni_G02381 [Canna indica]|uniref:Protein LURP-one-related 7 n=1 Tax=Canna indica TaxID=4628 RepID=A0AAQ3JPP6_9LILI|nr:hypothetical protein Cni_G02381 [Canna indica]